MLLAVDQAQVAPDIEPKLAANAVASYAYGARPEDILFLVDNSAMGGGENGVAATWGAVYAKSLFGRPVTLGLGYPALPFSVEDEDVLCGGRPMARLENVAGGLLPLNDVANALNFLAGRAAGEPDPPDPADSPAEPPAAAMVSCPLSPDEILARLSTLLAGIPQIRVKPGVSPRRAEKALAGYAAGVRVEDILFQAADDRRGVADYGLLAVWGCLYAWWSGSDPVCVPLGPEIPEVTVKDDYIGINGRRAARLQFYGDRAVQAVADALGFLARANAAYARAAEADLLLGPGGAAAPGGEGTHAAQQGETPPDPPGGDGSPGPSGGEGPGEG
jgi:hypothetical protein